MAGSPATSPDCAIARRDAGDRIDDITDPAERQALLAQAVRNGDTTLARALVQAAVESSDLDCVNQFAEAFPNLNDAVERLWISQHRKSIGVDLNMAFRLVALKPQPIHSLQDYEIALIASGQTTAGAWNA